MKGNQFPEYPQQLEDAIGELSEYLFEKYNDNFNVFDLEEHAFDDIDKSRSDYVLMDEYKDGVTQNL
jgi:hypothetical protein